MDDPLLMCAFQRLGDLFRDGQRFRERDWPFRNPVRQGRPLDEFHYERESSVRLLEAVDVCDVRMVQGGEEFGFALESGQAPGVGADGLGQDLDCDLALEIGIRGAIDLAHPAGAEGGDDFIRAEARAGSQSHPWRILARQA